MVIEQKRGVSASFSMYIFFCLNLDVFFTSEILPQFLKGCADFAMLCDTSLFRHALLLAKRSCVQVSASHSPRAA